MLTHPPIEGLPIWAQILISLVFGLAAVGIAFKGYFRDKNSSTLKGESQSAVLAAASIADMGAIRHLSDCVVRLHGAVDRLTDAVEESTHWERNNEKALNELCGRIRTLTEEIARHGK